MRSSFGSRLFHSVWRRAWRGACRRRGLVFSVWLAGYPVWYVVWVLVNLFLGTGEGESSTQVQAAFSPAAFVAQNQYYLLIYAGAATVLQYALVPRLRHEEYERAYGRQRQRLRLLERFSHGAKLEELCGKGSIYKAFRDMLVRAESLAPQRDVEEGSISNTPNVHLRLLLCAPVLDYAGRDSFQNWGREFGTILAKLMTNVQVSVQVAFLPSRTPLGIHPRDEFLQTLASYYEQDIPEALDFVDIHERMKRQVDWAIDSLEQAGIGNLNAMMQTLHDVPFQIGLLTGRDWCEVIVSFAGQEILEDIRADEPKGFVSYDPDVVTAFKEIFRVYTSTRRRKPLIPKHTLDIINETKKCEKNHYTEYCGFKINHEICPKIFSPFHANSSKHVTNVIRRLVNENRFKQVMDLGAGTGIQAIITRKLLRKKKIEANIIAVEGHDRAIDLLRRNRQGYDVDIYRGYLYARTNEGRVQLPSKFLTSEEYIDMERVFGKASSEFYIFDDGEWIDDGVIRAPCADDQIRPSEGELDIQADLIVADLPFVDARPRNLEEAGYLDLGHRTHETLFCAVRKGRYLTKEGLIVTAHSTLGGAEDVYAFETLIDSNDLNIIERCEFMEQGIGWHVYVLKRNGAENE